MGNENKKSFDWQEIGQRFRSVRLGRDYTQLKMGEVANQKKSAIGQFEIGSKPASTHYALFLRNEFGVSFDWLYDGVETKIKSSDREKKRILNPTAIGKRLKKFRKEEGLTLKEFGEWVGLPIPTIIVMKEGDQLLK
ncbi:helix-turn-helix domain-containing protein [Candidatus Liberibacter africanus]|uniref:helix-turn-helix domain-containing protein n=1 Tax=Liberibacter africanus TaxID=34020 RepID=UPI001FD272AA|nr:helix-turn-helix transcriptional regulator [Candidatus Liberibacter africanus]